MARILYGKEFAAKIKEEAGRAAAELKIKGIQPRLAVIIVGSDPASEVYVRPARRNDACGAACLHRRAECGSGCARYPRPAAPTRADCST